MPSEKRVRRLARWNEALGCFFTFPLALRQVILLFLGGWHVALWDVDAGTGVGATELG